MARCREEGLACGTLGNQARAEGLFREGKGYCLEERRGSDLSLDLPVTL